MLCYAMLHYAMLCYAMLCYVKLCYLETMPYMLDAQELYRKNGFVYINKPMGDTGHYSCPVWMTKEL